MLHWGAESEKVIDVYSALARPAENGTETPAAEISIDAWVARLERVVVSECEKGVTAASVKAAMDRVLDQMHRETGPARAKASQFVVRAARRVSSSSETARSMRAPRRPSICAGS